MFFFNIDTTDLDFLRSLDKTLAEAAKRVNRELAESGKNKAIELAASRLHSRRKMFIEGVSTFEAEQGVWVLHLDAKVRWIDDGMGQHDMLDNLLSSKKAKRAKDGSVYLIVPFRHGTGVGKGSATPAQMDLTTTIKSEMKQRGIPWSKMETDSSGKVKLGRIHSFDIGNRPLKTANAPGQGKGPIGDVRQGPTGIPFLQGISIYQKEDGKGGFKKDIMTFRIASSKHRGQGRWQHPGLKPVHIFDDTVKWMHETLDQKIVPQLMAEVQSMIS
jgi:hypothetical protein